MANINIIESFLKAFEKYEETTLPNLLDGCNMTPLQFKQILINEFSKSTQLQQAFSNNPSSFLAGVLCCAEIQLNPSQMIGEFYFVVRNGLLSPVIGYKGLVSLLMRSSKIKKIWSEVVYEGDDFEYELGLEPKLFHIPNHAVDRNSNSLQYVYACIKIEDEIAFKVLSKHEIKNLSEISNQLNELYFNDTKNPERWMEKKTTLKQLAKLMPMADDRVKKAIAMDDNLVGGGYLVLDENDNVKLVQETIISKKSSIYDKLKNSLPQN